MKRDLKRKKIIGGTIEVPGDKSVAHRVALFSLLSENKISVSNFPDNQDCMSSLDAVKSLGVKVEKNNGDIILSPPESITAEKDMVIDCGNSGTTVRLLAGLVAGVEGLEVTLDGDESLRSRPMKRIIDPLTEMGAVFFCEDNKLPMKIKGSKLLPFEYRLPVASAQVKSALLLAGLATGCSVSIKEDSITRDHTELMVEAIGENIQNRVIHAVMTEDPNDPRKKKMVMPEDFKKEIIVTPQTKIKGGEINIAGDMSTAAFFFAVAAISGKSVTIENLGLNPTRSGMLEYLKQIGCKVEISGKSVVSGEPRGTVTVTGGKLSSRKISGETTVKLIDEIPIIAVIGSFCKGTTVIRDASELKLKETDRLNAISVNLTKMGIKNGLLKDGIAIEGGHEHQGADFESFGDHRIAMAFSVASLFCNGPSTMDDADCVGVTCPTFYDLMDKIVK